MLEAKPSSSPLPYATPRRRTPRYASFSIAGAFIGLTVFLASALLPSLLHGGVAGLEVAKLVFGAPHAHVFGVHAFIVAGITTAVSALATLFALVGAVAGASVGALTSSLRER